MPSTRRKPPKQAETAASFVAYYRVSTSRQGESGLGLDAQKAAVRRHLDRCSAGAQLLAEYTEVESGKRHTNRPQLAAAIENAKRAGATLIIAKLDRLARNVAFIASLMESASDFVACDMPQANRLTIHILAAIAEHEREMISARTKAALEQVKARGVQLGNPRWRESIAKATAARRKAPQPADVRALIHAYRNQRLSLRAIAEKLNILGVKTPSGSRWYASSVRTAIAIGMDEASSKAA